MNNLATPQSITKFANKHLFLQYFVSTFSFYLGAKAIDFVFYDEKKFIVQREILEDEFW